MQEFAALQEIHASCEANLMYKMAQNAMRNVA